MFSITSPKEAPNVLSYGKIIKSIENKHISKVILKPNSTISFYETTDGEKGKASIIANDYFIEKATKNEVDIEIAQPEPKNLGVGDVVSLVIMSAILYSIFTTIQIGNQGGPKNPFNTFNFETVETTDITFNDVAGIDNAKDELSEIVEFLKNPQKYSEAGAKIPRGCLLFGEPGTGKTLLAKAIAGEANVPFIATSASQFVELFVGLGASRIRSLFKQARQNKPCIIFIDEIDTIGKSRSNSIATSGGTDEREQTLNQLLLEMDGFKDNEGIIVIGATNRPEILDQALLRPGRFDRKITVELPDKIGRKKILKVHSRNKNLDCSVDLDRVASATLGCSGAELENIMNEAAIMAARDQRNTITMNDINESLDKIILGLKTNKKISHKTKQIIAYHEAGHALMAAIVDGPQTVRKISIVPRGQTGGVTMFMPPVESEEINLQTKQYLENRIMVGLGGTVAEEIAFGPDNITTGAAGDIQQVTQIASAMIKDFGFSKKFGKISVSTNIDNEIKEVVDESYKSTKSLMLSYRDKLDEIANALLVNEVLETKEFMKIFKPSS